MQTARWLSNAERNEAWGGSKHKWLVPFQSAITTQSTQRIEIRTSLLLMVFSKGLDNKPCGFSQGWQDRYLLDLGKESQAYRKGAKYAKSKSRAKSSCAD